MSMPRALDIIFSERSAHRGPFAPETTGGSATPLLSIERRYLPWDLIMEALAETHDGSVQMIDTCIVRVHQHGGCAAGAKQGRWAGREVGLTTKIHACVDTNGMPVRLA